MIAGWAAGIAATKGKAITAALAGGATATGAGVIAQVTLDDLGILPQLGAGGLIAGAGIYALRIVLRAANHERTTATENEARLERALDRAERRAEDAETDLEAMRDRSRRLLLAYDRERAHRLALEQAGLTERRHQLPELEADAFLNPDDLEAIGVKPEELETHPDNGDTT